MELMTPLPPPPPLPLEGLLSLLPDAAAAAESPLVAGGEGSQSALAKPSCGEGFVHPFRSLSTGLPARR